MDIQTFHSRSSSGCDILQRGFTMSNLDFNLNNNSKSTFRSVPFLRSGIDFHESSSGCLIKNNKCNNIKIMKGGIKR